MIFLNIRYSRLQQIVIIFIASFLLCQSYIANAASPRDREYQIKSAFISNFIRYARWQKLPSDIFNFCTTDARVNTIVELGLDKERWHNLAPQFYIVSPGEEGMCQILFIDRKNTDAWQSYLIENQTANMLIIGEKKGFAKRIGHINFFLANNKLRFEINKKRLDKSNIQVSSSLLRLARLIDTGEQDL